MADEEHQALLQFLYLSPVGVLQLDGQGQISLLNPRATQVLAPLAWGRPLENLFAVLAPWAPDLLQAVAAGPAEAGPVVENLRLEMAPDHGREVGRVISLNIVRVDAARLMATVDDITALVHQERRLREQEGHLRAIFDSVRDYAIFATDLAGRVTSWNLSAQRLLGWQAEAMVGRGMDCFISEGDGGATQVESMLEAARKGGWYESEGWRLRRDGRRFWGSAMVSLLVDEEGRPAGYTCVLRDMSERKRMEDRLRELATTDFLTGAINRRHFRELAGREMARRRRQGQDVSLIMLDADHFKQVNDTHGHAAGDEVLKAMVGACKAELRENDLLVRLGGEEFAILLPGTPATGASVVAERIRESIEGNRVHPQGRPESPGISFTVSAGVAEMSSAVDDLDRLLQAADMALYAAKAAGRNRIVVTTATASQLFLHADGR